MVHQAESDAELGLTRAITGPAANDQSQQRSSALRPLTKADIDKSDLSGYQFGNYALAARLGQGGMGHIFAARHLSLDKACALKFICPEAQGSSEATARFLMEIKALGALDHPHIVTDFDAGCIDGLHYYVTELLDGHDLAGWIKKRGIPPLAACCEIIKQAALGLAHAHHHRFVHRDIKPANLFLTNAGVVKVLDFGLARHAQVASDLTSTHHLLGTVDYFAPEQAENAQRCTKASDIYSLGLTFIFLLSGEAPYPADRYPTIVSKLRGHMVDRPRWLNEQGHTLPPDLLRIIDAMIAKPVVDRFGHCGQIVEALRPWCHSDALSAWQMGTTGYNTQFVASALSSFSRPSVMTRRICITASAAALLLAATAIAWPQLRSNNTSSAVVQSSVTQAESSDNTEQPASKALADKAQPVQPNTVSITNSKPAGNARAMRLKPAVTPADGPSGPKHFGSSSPGPNNISPNP